MKKRLAAACVLSLAVMLLAETAFAADTAYPPAVIDSTAQTELLPADVVTSRDRLEIRKIYELSPDTDPGRLPRAGFERFGYEYECEDILREVLIGEEFKTVTVTEAAESKKNDTDTVLGLFPQYKEYKDGDGFAGNLLLNTATVKSEVSGYGSSGKEFTVSRSYPNLSDTDTQYIPKTLDDNGQTLRLQNVDWQTDNTMNVDDYEIGDRYTAVVTYAGTKTTSYVKGYNVTADYTGEVMRKGVTVIRYTVIFTGKEIPDQTPASTDSASERTLKAGPNGVTVWLPALLSSLALLGSGACLYLTLKNRKERPRYEKDSDDEHPDTYTDDCRGGPGAGGGDI